MGGALLQLVSYGKQNEELIGNPSISYFKYVHKRHTNFSMESISNNFNEQLDFDRKVSCTIGKHGDLLSNILLQITLPDIENNDETSTKKIGWTNSLGHGIIKKVELLIGGEIVDTLDGDWLDIYSEYYVDASKKKGYYEMIKYSTGFSVNAYNKSMDLYIPLPFWFCKNIGSALPLIALQYHEVTVNITLRPLSQCFYPEIQGELPKNTSIVNANLYCNYIFLDTKERKFFANNDHQYLIIQHQKSENNVTQFKNKSFKVDLDFNLPVKSLYWTLQNQESYKINLWNDYSLNPEILRRSVRKEILKNAIMSLNGQERFSKREGQHFRLVEPYFFGTIIPGKYIYTYNFSINPNNYQPSGTLNFSRIDSSSMLFDFKEDDTIDGDNNIDVKIYALNYNILLIKNGMAGVKYMD